MDVNRPETLKKLVRDLQIPEDVVAIGDEIAGCAVVEYSDLHGCSSTWNDSDKKPERIDIYLQHSSEEYTLPTSSSTLSSSSASSSNSSSSTGLMSS